MSRQKAWLKRELSWSRGPSLEAFLLTVRSLRVLVETASGI